LAEYFRELGGRRELVTTLKAVARERNMLAHAALAEALDQDGELDFQKAAKLRGRVDRARGEAQRLIRALNDASMPLLVALDLDELPDNARPKERGLMTKPGYCPCRVPESFAGFGQSLRHRVQIRCLAPS
jgi:hypothetical protein